MSLRNQVEIYRQVRNIGSWLVIKSVKVEKNASIVMFVTQSYHTNWGRQLLLGLTYWVRVRVRNQSISNQFFNLWCDVGISRLCILREKNDASHESFPLGLVPMSNSVVCQRVELGRTWAKNEEQMERRQRCSREKWSGWYDMFLFIQKRKKNNTENETWRFANNNLSKTE